MDKIFVIAGNNAQFEEYKRRKIEEMLAKGYVDYVDFRYDDIVYVSSANVLAGVSNPHGVFIGSWRERKDIHEILDRLMICSHMNNAAIQNIKQSLLVKPTPKKQPQAAVEEAAKALQEEIDRTVINQMKQDSSYTISYEQLLPTMIKAIQELESQLKGLKNAGNLPTQG